jgi:hypothetical protein
MGRDVSSQSVQSYECSLATLVIHGACIRNVGEGWGLKALVDSPLRSEQDDSRWSCRDFVSTSPVATRLQSRPTNKVVCHRESYVTRRG